MQLVADLPVLGEYRARSTLAAARAGLISELVVDEPQAAAIVRLYGAADHSSS